MEADRNLKTVWARFGAFELDRERGLVSVKGFAVKLQPQPMRVLELLVERAPEVVPREELGDHVWGKGVHVELDANVNYCIRQIRQALDDSASEAKYVETLPRQGYRFVAAVERVEEVAEAMSVPAPVTVEAERKGSRRGVWWAAAVVGVAVVLAGVGWLAMRHVPSGAPIRSLAVLPLQNFSGDSGQDYFADGMTDELTTELASIPNLRVASRTSAMVEKGSHKTLREIAGELNVDAVVEGSVVRSGDTVRITAQLIDARDDRHLWAKSFEGTSREIVALQDRVASEIATQAKVVLAPVAELGSSAASRTVVPEAHDAYLRGLYFYDRRDPIKSAEYFQRAVDLDPTYSSAYAGLADALTSEAVSRNLPADDVIDRARTAAKKAVELDPQNGDAYIALGFLEQTLSWDWKAAETNLLQGLALNPSSSVGLMVYALRMEASGDTDAALSYMRRARDNDPLSYYMERQYTAVLFYARRYDEALEELRRTKEMYPDASDRVIDKWMSWTYERKGMYDQAVEYDLRHGWLLNDADREALRIQYRQHGWRSYWQARLRKIPSGSVQGAEVYHLALICIRAGEPDKAFAILDAAASHHCFWLEEASVDPMLDDLRGDPRFAALLRKLNLPELHPNH